LSRIENIALVFVIKVLIVKTAPNMCMVGTFWWHLIELDS